MPERFKAHCPIETATDPRRAAESMDGGVETLPKDRRTQAQARR